MPDQSWCLAGNLADGSNHVAITIGTGKHDDSCFHQKQWRETRSSNVFGRMRDFCELSLENTSAKCTRFKETGTNARLL
jgi:hypothetical protein